MDMFDDYKTIGYNYVSSSATFGTELLSHIPHIGKLDN